MRAWFIAACLLAVSARASALGLVDVYNLAKQNDPVYASALAAYKAGMEKLPQARSALLPSVNLTALAARYDNSLGSPIAKDYSYTSPSLTLSLTQPLFRKQNLDQLEQARLQTRIAEAQLSYARQNLVLRTAQAYFDVLQAQDALATLQAQKAAIAEQLALAKKSFEVGTATVVDTHEAQASYDSTVAQEIAAENDLEVKRAALDRLIMAETPPELAPLSKSAQVLLPRPDDLTSWVKQARESSLPVVMNQSSREIAKREVARQRDGYLPNVDLAASYTDTKNGVVSGASGVDSHGSMIGVQLQWNLFQGGATHSLVREATANLEKADADLDNARRQAALDARQAYLGVISGNARVNALKQVRAAADTQLQSTKLGREVGVRTSVDVLNSEQQLYGAERDLAAARYAALMSGLNLKAAAGSLSEGDLPALDALLVK
jgi:outer membrane protein